MIKMQWLLDWFLKPRYEVQIAHKLYGWAVDQSRHPKLYLELGVSDTRAARFELLTLMVVLIVLRLRKDPSEQAKDTSQSLFDVYFAALDNMMREDGVGDLTVPKKMKKAAALIYTRLNLWDELLSDTTKNNEDRRVVTLLDTVYAKPEILGEMTGLETSSISSPDFGHALRLNEFVSQIWAQLTPTRLMQGLGPEIEIANANKG